jgi:hypothetical protein
MSFASDTFTDANSTPLSTHIPTGGGSWMPVTYVNELLITSGRARGQTNTRRTYAYLAAPATAEYDVSVDVYAANIANATSGVGPAGRMSITADTMYSGVYDNNMTQYKLQKIVAGSVTVLGNISPPLPWSSSETRPFLLRIRNDTKKLFVGGVEVLSSTDNSITAAGYAGLDHQGFSNGATAGWQFDNFEANDVGGAPAPVTIPVNSTDVSIGSFSIGLAQGARIPIDSDDVSIDSFPVGLVPGARTLTATFTAVEVTSFSTLLVPGPRTLGVTFTSVGVTPGAIDLVTGEPPVAGLDISFTSVPTTSYPLGLTPGARTLGIGFTSIGTIGYSTGLVPGARDLAVNFTSVSALGYPIGLYEGVSLPVLFTQVDISSFALGLKVGGLVSHRIIELESLLIKSVELESPIWLGRTIELESEV